MTTDPHHAPFEIHSIHFDFPGGQAIRLREPVSDNFVGATPEWVGAPPRNELAAYVRATQPHVQVVFRGTPAADGPHVVGADGTLSQVEEERVTLTFNPGSGLSAPVAFRLQTPLPDRIGLHPAKFDWYVRDPADPTICLPAGTSSHGVCTTWRALAPNPAQRLHNWVYRPLMEWTCAWASGQDDEQAICDAIIRNLGASGLRYGIRGYDVRRMLLLGGGMCSGWYQMFQQMAHCQGVFVHRRCFLVDWRRLPNSEEQWCALVIRAGGLNQPLPTPPPSEFQDNDKAFPIVTPVALTTRIERRYRFWGGVPGYRPDGHCINFLEYKGKLYLYDASFGAGPFEIDAPLPPDDLSILGGALLASFKARYLDAAVDYMLGTLYNGGVLHRSDRTSRTNGMTVRTALIPEVVRGDPGLTFYWGP
ncbi:MAG: hypothetical protein L0Z62_49280 [Gemmataceae bacterium]|nr:hypothetical protein [Gemmataceae bacterium]